MAVIKAMKAQPDALSADLDKRKLVLKKKHTAMERRGAIPHFKGDTSTLRTLGERHYIHFNCKTRF